MSVYVKKQETKKICKYCKKTFKTNRNNKIYCSDNCKYKAWKEKQGE